MRYMGLVLMVALIAGCTTVSDTFGSMKPDYSTVPEQTLKNIAQEVEAAVSAGNRQPTIADRDGVVLSTEEIQQAIRTRAARFQLVDTLLNSGYAWEEKNGLIAILRSKEYKKNTTSQQRDRDALVVLSENNDRWAIYEGIRKASKFPPSSLGAIQNAFYQARVAVLSPGQKYETPDGELKIK